MKSQQQYDKLIEEARARIRKLNAQIEAHPNYAQSAAEWDAEYAAARTKILFVCHGNICRSPMAEFVGSSRDIADPWYTGNFDATYSDPRRLHRIAQPATIAPSPPNGDSSQSMTLRCLTPLRLMSNSSVEITIITDKTSI